ncbi:zinc metalloprotease HtpX [Patescibacteria group bacterium]|nr:zinc metalloprotease HtpX [Patescibacteria group bacterium]MBU1705716.1 zinc metalloprotease HtpX [Patescibacteria group bacterium]
MYSEIARNKRKTIFLMAIFAVVILLLGWIFGQYTGSAEAGLIAAAIIATVMTLFGYFKGDSVALISTGAKQIQKRDLPQVYLIVENLTIAAGLPMPKVYVINDPSPNAFATGRDPAHASLALTTGLIQIMDKLELEGVIAHELAHIKNYDIRVMTIVIVLVGVILLLSDWLMRTFLFSRGRRSNDEAGQLAMFLFLAGLILAVLSPFIAELIKLAVSRSREYLADASGALLTRYPEGLARALEKIAQHDRPLKNANHATAHLFIANPFDPYVTKKFEHLFSTHPPIMERIKKLRQIGV